MSGAERVAASQPEADETAPARSFAERYVLSDVLGTGGMGTVHRARDRATGRDLALKQLKLPARPRDAAMLRALFEREFHTLARLGHPHIVSVYDYGVCDGAPYYTMELLDGQDLEALAPLAYPEACRLLCEVASALALLHAHRLVHRDISPRNVRLTAAGQAKLIDFGALAPFGPAPEIAGTPMCVAPEALRRAPLDQRSDLYALGALAYWLLTGRAAYSARIFAELPDAWQRSLVPPSTHRPEIPLELDRLILSLLDPDSQARPSNAGLVIERLRGIANLPDEPALGPAARSYLASGPMLGRETESDALKRRVCRARDGKGGEILIEGPPGIGRSRLLQELCLDAQLEAACCLRADAEGAAGPHAIPLALALALLDTAPELARAAAGADASRLAELSPALAQRLGFAPAVKGDQLDQPPLTAALAAWFLRVAERTPLLFAIDNIQTADPGSVAFLEAVGRASRSAALLVVSTQRSGAALRAPALLAPILKRSSRIRLRGLSALGCEALVKSLFGDVPNSGRLAKLLRERSAGSPEQCMRLARSLVERGSARYLNGSWLLPLELGADELEPASDLLLSLAGLSPPARALCAALSVHEQPLGRGRCRALVPEMEERMVHAALDELVGEQVLVNEHGHYRFALQPLQLAVHRQLPEAERRERHLWAAEDALAGVDPLGRESGRPAAKGGGQREPTQARQRMRAAHHLFEAGETDAGLEWAADAASELAREVSNQIDCELASRTLRTAERACEGSETTSLLARAQILCALVSVSFFAAQPLELAVRERALRLGLRLCGLSLAGKLARWLGPRLSLWLGARFALLRHRRMFARAATSPQAASLELRAALTGCVPAAIATSLCEGDADGCERLALLLAPLRLLPADDEAAPIHALTRAALDLARGRDHEARMKLGPLLVAFRSAACASSLGPARQAAALSCSLFELGRSAALEGSPRASELARELAALPWPVSNTEADQILLLQLATRGAPAQTDPVRERIELAAVAGTPTWQAERLEPLALLHVEFLAQSSVGVRRARHQLTRAALTTPSLAIYAELAAAAELALRKDHARAIAAYEQILLRLRPRRRAGWREARWQLAATLLEAGQPARACRLLEDTLAQRRPDEPEGGLWLELRRQHALAQSALGHHAAAASVLDRMLAEHAAAAPSLAQGLLHQARAEVALRMRDASGLALHYAQMDRCFRVTQNPSWLGRAKALRERVARTSLAPR